MNILFIGNSFSEDCTRYLQDISGKNLYVRVLFIGACSLEKHWQNFSEGLSDYLYEENAESIGRIELRDALTVKDWDVIVLQQYSRLSGVYESYEPYIGNLIDGIKEICPKARFVFHRTWAYEDGCPELSIYENDRHKMFSAIKKTTDRICEKYHLDIIPSGDAVELARLLPECVPGSKYCMTRDEQHLSLEYGRYLGALVCYRFFVGKNAAEVEFDPKNTDHNMNEKLKVIADKAFE